MKRINAYETTDGKVFSDRKAAKEHQRSLNVAKSLRALAGTDTALADFLVNNADALKKALAGTVEEPKEEGDGYAAAATAEVPAPTVAEVTSQVIDKAHERVVGDLMTRIGASTTPDNAERMTVLLDEVAGCDGNCATCEQ